FGRNGDIGHGSTLPACPPGCRELPANLTSRDSPAMGPASQLTPHSGEAVVAPCIRHGGAIPGQKRGRSSLATANWSAKAHVEAQIIEVQTRSPHGRKHLGPSEKLGEPPQLWPRPARPTSQEQGV